MNAVVAILGGVRATVFAAVALLLLVVAGIQSCRHGSVVREFDGYKTRVQQSAAEALAKAKIAQAKAHQAAAEYDAAMARADASYEAGRQSAITYQNNVVADLRAGNLRLRGEWAACMSRPAKVEAPSSAAGVGEPAADVSAEAFGRVLRIGSDADNEIKWYQQALKATRDSYNQCAGIVETP